MSFRSNCLSAATLLSMSVSPNFGSFAHAETYAVVTSSKFESGTTTLGKLAARIAHETLQREDGFLIYDGSEQKLIASMQIPAQKRFENPAARLGEVRRNFKLVARFMKQSESAVQSDDNDIFGTLRDLADDVLSSVESKPARVLIYADVLHHDLRELSYSWRNNTYPKDSHLTVDVHRSPFGTVGREKAYENVDVYICYSTQFTNRIHQENVYRFYALYFGRQGGHLATFTDDITSCQKRFLAGDKSARQFTINPNSEEPTMIRIEHQQASAETLTGQESDQSVAVSTEQPQATLAYDQGGRFLEQDIPVNAGIAERLVARAKVGTRWACDCDFDLHISHPDDDTRLNYEQTVNTMGRFSKDWRNSPDAERAYEYIDFFKPIDVLDLDIWINFFSGEAPNGAKGTIRIWIEGQDGVWEAPFEIPSNTGRAVPYRDGSPYWVKIDPRSVLNALRAGN